MRFSEPTLSLWPPALALALIVVLGACEPSPPDCVPLPPPSQTQIQPPAGEPAGPDATGGRIEIYADATTSMVGFTHSGHGSAIRTPYQDMIRALPTLMDRMSDEVRYHAFGSIIQDIGPPAFRKAAGSDDGIFYRNPALKQDTRIGPVLARAIGGDHGQLSIVVTDLFLSGEDLPVGSTSPLRRPLMRALQNGQSVGILAVRSPFRGRIFDFATTPNHPGLQFAGERPFFLLMVGPHERIERAYGLLYEEVLKDRPEGTYHFLIISRRLVREPALTGIIDTQAEPRSGSGGPRLQPILKGHREILQFRLKRDDLGRQALQIRVPLERALLPFRTGVEDLEVHARLFVHFAAGSDCGANWREQPLDAEIGRAETDAEGTALVLRFFEPAGAPFILLPDSVYFADLEVVGRRQARRPASLRWVDEWSYDARSEEALLQSSPPRSFFPTLNLAPLVAALQDLADEQHPPEIVAKLQLVFQTVER